MKCAHCVIQSNQIVVKPTGRVHDDGTAEFVRAFRGGKVRKAKTVYNGTATCGKDHE